MSEYNPADDTLAVDAECTGPDVVILDWDGGYVGCTTVSAYEAFEIAGRIQAAAVRAMMGVDAPATYNPEQLARIERLKRVIPEGGA